MKVINTENVMAVSLIGSLKIQESQHGEILNHRDHYNCLMSVGTCDSTIITKTIAV